MAIPLALGFAASYVLSLFHYAFSVSVAVQWGLYSQVIYAFVANVIKRIKNGGEVNLETLDEDFNNAKTQVKSDSEKLADETSADERFGQIVEEIKRFK